MVQSYLSVVSLVLGQESNIYIYIYIYIYNLSVSLSAFFKVFHSESITYSEWIMQIINEPLVGQIMKLDILTASSYPLGFHIKYYACGKYVMYEALIFCSLTHQ